MDIDAFTRILRAFADEPSDIDIRAGKLVGQIRDEILEVALSYATDESRELLIEENGTRTPARTWLLSRIAKLPQLADRILAAFNTPSESSVRSPFIEPAGSYIPDLSSSLESVGEHNVPSAVETLLGRANRPMPGATGVLYLTSDAGEGKTTVITRVAVLQAQRYKSKQARSLIVPIPLSGVAFLTFDDAVVAALVNKLRFSYLYFDAFVQLVRLGAIVPAFDGYEEMLVEGSKGEAVSALGNLVQTLDSEGTIIVSARKAFFEYVSFKTQARLLDAIGEKSASFSRLSLQRWSKTQFCEYGRKRNVADPEATYGVVAARLGAEHPILTRAVLVRRLFDVVAGGADTEALSQLLGSNPQDYFYTFVDAIIQREASEKWLAKVSGDVSEPLLQAAEHHVLLAQVAQEMWLSSTTSLRDDVLDVIVDLFAESTRKAASTVRQIKERLKQHSLLAVDGARQRALAFDHDDFQRFYLGEALGQLLARQSMSEARTFLSINVLPSATLEQAIQSVVRASVDRGRLFAFLRSLDESEPAFSFCKENCAALLLRLCELGGIAGSSVCLTKMHFSVGSLAGRALDGIRFVECSFQPTSLQGSTLTNVCFEKCEFERLEVYADDHLKGCEFVECDVRSLVVHPEEYGMFDPSVIADRLRDFGAKLRAAALDGTHPSSGMDLPQGNVQDECVRITEKFFRIFLRSTNVDEEVIRVRLGKNFAPRFMADILPTLVEAEVIEEIPWRGRGVQRRFRLAVAMSDVNNALERSGGDFERLLTVLRARAR